jgi:hypothetical protein
VALSWYPQRAGGPGVGHGIGDDHQAKDAKRSKEMKPILLIDGILSFFFVLFVVG